MLRVGAQYALAGAKVEKTNGSDNTSRRFSFILSKVYAVWSFFTTFASR